MFILASKSPRRKELLSSQITRNFSIIFKEIDESASYIMDPKNAVRDIAFRKGEIIHQEHYNDVTLSADTIVVLDKQIIGKPKDEQDAKRILRMLSNKKHEVITAYCIFYQDKLIRKEVISQVEFNNLNEKLIDDYVKSGSPLDKAGAYGIQDGQKYPIVKEYIGSYHNIMGFPIEEIKEDLIKNGIPF